MEIFGGLLVPLELSWCLDFSSYLPGRIVFAEGKLQPKVVHCGSYFLVLYYTLSLISYGNKTIIDFEAKVYWGKKHIHNHTCHPCILFLFLQALCQNMSRRKSFSTGLFTIYVTELPSVFLRIGISVYVPSNNFNAHLDVNRLV